MVRIDWTKYDPEKTVAFLDNTGITEMNWNGVPSTLETLYLHKNNIKKMDWIGAPSSLRKARNCLIISCVYV